MMTSSYLPRLAAIALLTAVPAVAQFSPEVLAERAATEEFLRTAEITNGEQMEKSEGVNLPWKLTLSADGVERFAVWKNPSGRKGGFVECWKCEIAAYELDKYLGVDMVPPTVERRYKNEAGSLVIWVDHQMTGRKKLENKVPVPSRYVSRWNRMTYLQRAFDDTIGNADRHMGNVLIGAEWEMFLIDHTRSFYSTKAYTKKRPNRDKKITSLPRTFVDGLRALDEAKLREIVGDNLTDKEVGGVMARRQLLLAFVDEGVRVDG